MSSKDKNHIFVKLLLSYFYHCITLSINVNCCCCCMVFRYIMIFNFFFHSKIQQQPHNNHNLIEFKNDVYVYDPCFKHDGYVFYMFNMFMMTNQKCRPISSLTTGIPCILLLVQNRLTVSETRVCVRPLRVMFLWSLITLNVHFMLYI